LFNRLFLLALDESGQGALEYSLIIAVVVIELIFGLNGLRNVLGNSLDAIGHRPPGLKPRGL